MSYLLIYTPKAEQQINKLPAEMQRRLFAALGRIRIRPHSFVKRLVGSPYFSLRAGKYRAILDINEGRLIILIIYIEKRDKVYEELRKEF